MSLWVVVVLGVLIAFYNTPRRKQIRARRRAEQQRVEALKQLSLACMETRNNAVTDWPHLKYHQDVRWIEWHTKLADPMCSDPGNRPVVSLEQIAKDFPMSASGRFGFAQMAFTSFRMIDSRKRPEQVSS